MSNQNTQDKIATVKATAAAINEQRLSGERTGEVIKEQVKQVHSR
jgi:hypothetical protein